LDDVVVPTPSDAPLIPAGYCHDEQTVGAITTCSFGVDPANARGTVALIGDSHARALGPAMTYVAAANGWHGVAIIRNSCSLSGAPELASAGVSSSDAKQCLTWAQAVTSWLGRHPEVTTVVISGRAGRRFAGSPEAGFQRAWEALPSSIQQIFIVRDVPSAVVGESDCVQRALARHQAAGSRCAPRRSATLAHDSEAAAASDPRSRRVRLLDFTPFFCDKRRCFPVVGGVLVLRDLHHLTHEFAVTLGPYLLRSINGGAPQRLDP
jgi:hypothetical protein